MGSSGSCKEYGGMPRRVLPGAHGEGTSTCTCAEPQCQCQLYGDSSAFSTAVNGFSAAQNNQVTFRAQTLSSERCLGSQLWKLHWKRSLSWSPAKSVSSDLYNPGAGDRQFSDYSILLPGNSLSFHMFIIALLFHRNALSHVLRCKSPAKSNGSLIAMDLDHYAYCQMFETNHRQYISRGQIMKKGKETSRKEKVNERRKKLREKY